MSRKLGDLSPQRRKYDWGIGAKIDNQLLRQIISSPEIHFLSEWAHQNFHYAQTLWAYSWDFLLGIIYFFHLTQFTFDFLMSNLKSKVQYPFFLNTIYVRSWWEQNIILLRLSIMFLDKFLLKFSIEKIWWYYWS